MPHSPEFTYSTGAHRCLPVSPPLYEAYFTRVEGCTAGASQPMSEKCYDKTGIGVVISGRFHYRSQAGMVTGVPGTVLFGNSGEQFGVHYIDSPNSRRLVVWYDDKFLENVAEAFEFDEPRFRSVALPPSKAASRMYAQIQALAKGSGDADDAACALAAAALAVGDERKISQTVSSRDQRRILSVVGYIEHAFHESCSVDDLANMSGLSRYHFMRQFKAVTGQSANQYVINTRLREAAARILETKSRLSEIAFDVGFNDISHFNTCFRTTFDCTPRQMRRLARAA